VLDHNCLFLPLKEHPLGIKIKEQFNTLAHEKYLTKLFDENLGFIYPKTISFSLAGYFNRLKHHSFDINAHDNNFNNMYSDIECRPQNPIKPKEIEMFLNYLLEALEKCKLSYALLIDLYGILIYDEITIEKIPVCLKSINYTKPVFILSSSEYHDRLRNVFDNFSVNISDNFNTLVIMNSEFFAKSDNIIKYDLPEKVDLESLEMVLDNPASGYFSDKFVVIFDFEKVNAINFFSICTLSIYLHTLRHLNGISCKLVNINRSIRKKLDDLKFSKVNCFFSNDDEIQLTGKVGSDKVFGISLFNKPLFKRIMVEFSTYLLRMKDPCPGLNTPIMIHGHQTKIDGTVDKWSIPKPRESAVYNIVKELCENVAMHSKGIGYIAAKCLNDTMVLFIGDTGIGIKAGMHANYEVDAKANSDTYIIHYLFNLEKFTKNRKLLKPWVSEPGQGLKDTFRNLSGCEGKVIVRSHEAIGSFVNTIRRTAGPTKKIDSKYWLEGTQYFFAIPLSKSAIEQLPNNTDELMGMEI
jgi:hypothetical protein